MIITGSEDGYWSKSKEIPEFTPWTLGTGSTGSVEKGSLLEIMTGIPPLSSTPREMLVGSKHWPADYWRKGYARIWWDFTVMRIFFLLRILLLHRFHNF